MPVNDDLIRQLNMGGMDHQMAVLLAEKHSEQRVVKLRVNAHTPHVYDGTLSAFTLQPGEQLLGYVGAVGEIFHTPLRAHAIAGSAPTFPVTAAPEGQSDFLSLFRDVHLADGVYNTLQELVDGLNAGTDHDTLGTWSSQGGKLRIDYVEFVFGLVNPIGGLRDQVGFGDDPPTTWTQPVLPSLSVFAKDSDPVNELFNASLQTSDYDQGNGLFNPAVIGGIPDGQQVLGYRPATADPIPFNVAIRDSWTGDLIDPAALTGAGDAFLWVWLSSMF